VFVSERTITLRVGYLYLESEWTNDLSATLCRHASTYGNLYGNLFGGSGLMVTVNTNGFKQLNDMGSALIQRLNAMETERATEHFWL
jgi:hypothetical protein